MRSVPPMPPQGKLDYGGRAVPLRTCVGCRVRTVKSELLRLVVVGSEIIPDQRGRLQGRGAYVHPALSCLELAERRRAFPRSFRVAGPLDVARLRAHLAGLDAE
ncbi:YlxR family protein [Sphaerisporangium perillae]|uniref:YlxR family protein n=1 Tax=Sphaerisporangium perillae TaxID=2935860 RepID=UPI0027E0C8C3|nr:YlxR family protein [Sphaerisporangium perillae]